MMHDEDEVDLLVSELPSKKCIIYISSTGIVQIKTIIYRFVIVNVL